MDADKPIIVIKKKGGHGGHHGGAWKIAYADFVTAMMAFFLVMWLVNSASTPTKERIASYFRRPGLFEQGSGTPLQIGGSGILDDAYVPASPEEKQNEVGESQMPRKKGFEEGPYPDDTLKEGGAPPQATPKQKQEMTREKEEQEEEPIEEPEEDQQQGGPPMTPPLLEEATPEEVAQEIKEEMESSPELENILGAVDVSADADSLNVEIMDTDKTSMFASGSAFIREEAREAFKKLAAALARVNNKIEIVGHTDAHPFTTRNRGYSNWELSVDRANAARRLLIGDGVDPGRITGVLGKAETQPKDAKDPFAAANRRITLKMKFDIKRPPAVASPQPGLPSKQLDMRKDPAAGQKLEDASKELEEAAASSGPAPLERVHSLTPKEVIERSNMKTAKPAERKALPAARTAPSFEWKDPKFAGEK